MSQGVVLEVFRAELEFGPPYRSLDQAVEAVAAKLNNAVKPVLVGGVKLRPSGAEEAFRDLADACG